MVIVDDVPCVHLSLPPPLRIADVPRHYQPIYFCIPYVMIASYGRLNG